MKRTCPVCNEKFTPPTGQGRHKIYCSTQCKRWASNHLRPDTGPCEVVGCGRASRARGLCSSHYNRRLQPDRHKRKAMECAACGSAVEKFPTGKGRRVVCSMRCRYFLTWGRWPASKELVHVGPRTPVTPPTIAPVTVVGGNRRIIVSGPCLWCGETFTRVTFNPSTIPSTCSKRCARRESERRRGTRSQFITDVARRAIYERDGWTCQLCFEPVDRDADPWSDWFPSLDHIVPQSHTLIPDHSPANLRTAHRWCNAVRGDGTYHAKFFEEAS